MDPHWEWHEVRTVGGDTRFVRGVCRHLEVAPVVTRDGAIVAGLCLTCDAQLPAGASEKGKP